MNKAITFIILFVFWFLFSGKPDAIHLGMGVFAAGFITYISGDLWFTNRKRSSGGGFKKLLKVMTYSIWLLKEITLANIQVLMLFNYNVNLLNVSMFNLSKFNAYSLNIYYLNCFVKSLSLSQILPFPKTFSKTYYLSSSST